MADAASVLAAAVAAAATAGLAALALRGRWVDRREGQEERKPRRSPVPLVGGVAVALGLLAWSLAGGGALPWPALGLALALGTLDDVRPGGLAAHQKLAGQLAVGVLLALTWPASGAGPLERATLGLLAVVAMNAVNTWDNADGAAGVLAALALGPTTGPGAAVLGYLPFNLVLRRAGVGGERPPRAMLGDGGSHLLGVLLATTPGAALFLVVPLLDLARLVRVRRRLGRAPWQGDRRHVAHRLEALGFGPVAVAGCLAALLAPQVLARWIAPDGGLGPLAALAAAALWFATLRLTPDPDDPGTGGAGPAAAGREGGPSVLAAGDATHDSGRP